MNIMAKISRKTENSCFAGGIKDMYTYDANYSQSKTTTIAMIIEFLQ